MAKQHQDAAPMLAPHDAAATLDLPGNATLHRQETDGLLATLMGGP